MRPGSLGLTGGSGTDVSCTIMITKRACSIVRGNRDYMALALDSNRMVPFTQGCGYETKNMARGKSAYPTVASM